MSQPGDSAARRPFLAPEVIQISTIDCGVAAIACFLRGCGVPANYERLREACQTDVDGTSIDTLEDVARQVGVDCVQHLLPDATFLLEAIPRLPVIAVSTTPSGYAHFIVLWRKVGPLWQVMNPANGRRWMRESELRAALHTHTQRFAPADFRAWAEHSSFLSGLRQRIARLVGAAAAEPFLQDALGDAGWQSFAALDAATRFVEAMRENLRQKDARHLDALLRRAFTAALQESAAPTSIPAAFWSIRPTRGGHVALTGHVMLAAPGAVSPSGGASTDLSEAVYLRRALSEPTPSLLALVKPLLRRTMWSVAAIVALFTVATVGIALFEMLAIRVALTDLVQFSEFSQKLGVVVWLVSLFAILLGLDFAVTHGQRRLGRTLEVRLRLALFGALPSLEDNFIRSRPTSDLAQRAQMIHLVRDIPALCLYALRSAADLACTLLIIALLDPWLAGLVLVGGLLLALVTYVTGVRGLELERKVQANGAALLHVFQDALLGVVPLRVHGAEIALRNEHNARLLPWFSAQRERLSQGILALSAQGVVTALVLLLTMLRGHAIFPDGAKLVMLLFWALRVPLAAQTFIGSVQAFPIFRLSLERALEPVRGGERRKGAKVDEENTIYRTGTRGVSLRFENVQVVAAGRAVLQDLSLSVHAGEHVAIVGRSGAGKSTLLSLLLGLRAPSHGNLWVDDKELVDETLHALRRQTAWIDPGVQLWNEAFLANLMYGQDEVQRAMNQVLEASDLVGVVERLPDGLMTKVGADGTLLSGGEGQRLRVGRALLNKRPRLALLDEPFRGLDRDLRKKMLGDLRDVFCRETLLIVTHDVEHVTEFDRVLVVEDGHVVEDGPPAELLARQSRFRDLYRADLANKETVWSDHAWVRLEVAGGEATRLEASDEPEEAAE